VCLFYFILLLLILHILVLLAWFSVWPWTRRQYIPAKRQHTCTSPHGVTAVQYRWLQVRWLPMAVPTYARLVNAVRRGRGVGVSYPSTGYCCVIYRAILIYCRGNIRKSPPRTLSITRQRGHHREWRLDAETAGRGMNCTDFHTDSTSALLVG
jgi:hypothetical protein